MGLIESSNKEIALSAKAFLLPDGIIFLLSLHAVLGYVLTP